MKNIEKVSLGISTFIDKSKNIYDCYNKLTMIELNYTKYSNEFIECVEELKQLIVEEDQLYSDEDILNQEEIDQLYDDLCKYKIDFSLVDLLIDDNINLPYYRVINKLYDKTSKVKDNNVFDIRTNSMKYDFNKMVLMMLDISVMTFFLHSDNKEEELNMIKYRNKYCFLNSDVEKEEISKEFDFDSTLSLRSDMFKGSKISRNSAFIPDMITDVMKSLYIDEYSEDMDEKFKFVPIKLFLLGSLIPLCNERELGLINRYREYNLSNGSLELVDDMIEENINKNVILNNRLERIEPSKQMVKVIERTYNNNIRDNG